MLKRIPTPTPEGFVPRIGQGGGMVTIKIELCIMTPFIILSKFTCIFNVHMELQPFSVLCA